MFIRYISAWIFVNQAKALSRKMRIIIFGRSDVLRSDAIAEDVEYNMECGRNTFPKKRVVL